MKLLSREQIEKLTTRRLLAYRDSLLRCHDHQNWDRGEWEQRKLTKDSPEWQEHYAVVKDVLKNREHINTQC